ncbi:hypothetical protein [Clostridium sulfidigenes]|uniref:hypothetical protein n=1 Tax=Clostridium sulfidigenes TaxID=318464 RepID=UPI003F8C8C25
MNDIEQVLQIEYSEEFDKLRKNRMFVSYHKYGPIKNNYGEGLISSVENLEIRLKKYKETGNTEFLVDVANFAMIEFMYPKHSNAHFDSENHGTRLKGMTVNDLKQL